MQSGWKKDYTRYKDFFLNVVAAYNNKPDLKIYLELVLSLVTIVAFSVFAIRPTLLTIIQLTKEISDKEESVINLNQKIKDLQTANFLLQSRTDDLILISQAIPDGPSPDIFIRQIEKIIKDSNLSIINFSLSDVVYLGENKKTSKSDVSLEELAKRSDSLPFTISLTGNYQSIYNFLSVMENMRRPVKIDTLAINSNTLDLENKLILNLSGRIPYIK